MRDLIDLGNLVFNRLISDHGETEAGRLLFLYGITIGSDWHDRSTNKVVNISLSGVSHNFGDPVISKLNEEWVKIIQEIDIRRNAQALAKMRAEYEIQLKPGDIYEFGKSSGEFRQLNFNF